MAPTEMYPAPARILSEVAARDLLSRKPAAVFRVSPEHTVLETIAEMAAHRVGALLVMEGPNVVGIVSERDCAVRCVLGGKAPATTKVSEIMTRSVVTVGPASTMQACMQLMTTQRVRHLPVVDDGRVVGVLSIGDVVREALEQQGHALEELERYVTGEPRLVRNTATAGR